MLSSALGSFQYVNAHRNIKPLGREFAREFAISYD